MKYAFPLDPELSFLPFQFTRNRLEHIIAAADPADYPARQNLRYELTLNAPEFPGLQMLEPFITLPSREKPPMVSGGQSTYEGAKFTMQAELDGLLSREKPAFRQAHMSVISSLTTPFSFTEVIRNNGVEIRNQVTPPQWAIKSGISELDHAGWGAAYWTHFHFNRFLTWQPDNKVVGQKQEEYLHFLLNFSPTPSSIRLRADITFTDYSSAAVYPLAPIQNVPFGRVLCIPVSPEIVTKGLTKPVLDYKVYLVDQNEYRLSEIRTYKLDRRPKKQERAILFSNSFHTYDTLRLVGEASETHKVQRFYADRERPIGAGVEFSDLFMIDKIGEKEFTISTGYFDENSAEVQRYLSEFLMAEEWFLMTEKGHEPIELVTSNQVSNQDNAGLVARQYQFRHVRDASNNSFLPVPPTFPTRPVYWKPSKPQFVLNAFGKRTGFVRYGRLEKTYADTQTPFIPITSKANSPGDTDFIPEFRDMSIPVNSTPYPSTAINKLSSFTRSNCGAGYIGSSLSIVIPAGKYGGENPGEANSLAELEYNNLNTQAYANQAGSCEINTTPFHVAIHHKIPMNPLKVVGSENYGPVVKLLLNGSVVISNTTGNTPPNIRLSDETFMPGKYSIEMTVDYGNYPVQACRLRMVSKSKELNVYGPGTYSFGEIQVNSNDTPLTVEVI
jgi:hypothetical protein